MSRRQTVLFLPVNPRDESHRDPEYIDFSVPRLARYMHSAWKRRQDAVFWVDIELAIKEGLTFYQTRSNAIILQGTLPAHCIVRAERLKTGEKLCERQYLSPRPPPKISLKHDHNWTKGNDHSGSTVEHHPIGKLVQKSLGEALQAGSSKPTQSKPNPIGDRTVTPVTQEIVGKLQGELGTPNVHILFEGSGASNTTKIPRKRPKEREKRIKTVAGEGKKSAKFWAPTVRAPTLRGPTLGGPTLRGPTLRGPTLRGPTLRGPTLRGPTTSGPHFFWVWPPPFGAPPFGPHPSGPPFGGPPFGDPP